MQFIKHVGKHGDRRVAIIYRTVPDESHMALVVYPETLRVDFHDALMKIIESPEGQDAEQLADALFKRLLPDGRPMLQTLHKEGMIKKIQTSQIVITPNATSHVRLDELNKIFDGIEAGGDAAEKLADLDTNAGLVDPATNRVNEVADVETSEDGVTDTVLAGSMISQSEQMALESKSLLAESKRLKKEAYTLNPALKPKKVVKKKAAKKKAAKSTAG